MNQGTWAYVVVLFIIVLVIMRFAVWPFMVSLRIGKIKERYYKFLDYSMNSMRDDLEDWQYSYLLQNEKVDMNSRQYRDLLQAMRMSSRLSAYSTMTHEKRAYADTLRKLGHPLLGKAGSKSAEKLCTERLKSIYNYVFALEAVDLALSFNRALPGAIQQKPSINGVDEIEGLVHNRFEDATRRKPSRILFAGTDPT